MSSPAISGHTRITITVNRCEYAIEIEPRTSLLDAIREQVGLTGPKKGCNQGGCGACTVLVDGHRILACLGLAIQYDGSDITTVEGLAEGDKLHSLQHAFIEHDGFQCGYCTPGQLCSAIGMMAEFDAGLPSAVSPSMASPGNLSDDEIRERMSGNLCRCGAYVGICAAIRSVR